MISLLAHHVENEHYPILAIFFLVGCWLGWQIVSYGLNRSDKDKVPVRKSS